MKGSILVFSLVMLAVLTIVSVGIASVTLIEKKNAGGTGKSTQALQVADSGVEVAMKKIASGENTVRQLAGSMICDDSGGKAVISGNIGQERKYSLSFQDEDENFITRCDDATAGIAVIISTGNYSGTSRKIAVAAISAGIQVTDGDFIPSNETQNIGSDWKLVMLTGQNTQGNGASGGGGYIFKDRDGKIRALLYSYTADHNEFEVTSNEKCVVAPSSPHHNNYKICARVNGSGDLIVRTGARVQLDYVAIK